MPRGWFPQVLATPVGDYIFLGVFLGPEPITFVVCMLRTCATFVLLGMFVAATIAVTLSES